MEEIDDIFFLDYPDLLITKKITEEGRENIRKFNEMWEDFIEKHNIGGDINSF